MHALQHRSSKDQCVGTTKKPPPTSRGIQDQECHFATTQKLEWVPILSNVFVVFVPIFDK